MAEQLPSPGRFTLEFTAHELVLLNNALNEVCHGVDIDDAEFLTRLGGSRAEAKALLDHIGRALDIAAGPGVATQPRRRSGFAE
jgi:hypothetical protein